MPRLLAIGSIVIFALACAAHAQQPRVQPGGPQYVPPATNSQSAPGINPSQQSPGAVAGNLPNVYDLMLKIDHELQQTRDKLNQEILAKNAAIKAANDRINQLETQLNAFQQIYATHTHDYGRVGLNWTSPQDAVQRDNILVPYRPAAKALPLDVQTTGAPKSPY